MLTDLWSSRSDSNAIWTYAGLTSGAFRIFPGLRMPHEYVANLRPWYHRAITNEGANVVSAPYLDAFGAGKIVTVAKTFAQPGPQTPGTCSGAPSNEPGCPCATTADCADTDCVQGRCMSPFVQGVLAVDFKYTHFADLMHAAMQDTLTGIDASRTCDATYTCSAWDAASASNQNTDCTVKCYLIDNNAHLVMDDAFTNAPAGDTYAYSDVPLSRREGSLMQRLVLDGVFERQSTTNFQGTCLRTADRFNEAVTSANLTVPASDVDAVRRARGYFPPWGNEFDCAAETVDYALADSVSFPLSGSYRGACTGGTYHLQPVPGTNMFALVIEDYYTRDVLHPLGCHGALVSLWGGVCVFVVVCWVVDTCVGVVLQSLNTCTRKVQSRCWKPRAACPLKRRSQPAA